MNKKELLESFKVNLNGAKKLREAVKENEDLYKAKTALKAYQTKRMEETHKNLLDDPQTRDAAIFFLSEVYSDKDLTQRDKDLTSLTPIIEKTFPESTLRTIALAIELDYLTERLDIQMAMKLGPTFTDEEYNAAFREVGSQEDRKKQLSMVQSLGDSLAGLVKIPGLYSLIKLMRKPARMANLEEIHDFMEKGFGFFKETKNPKEFIRAIIDKETSIMDDMYVTA